MRNALTIRIRRMPHPDPKVKGSLIEDVYVQIPERSIISFLAPTGAGKTTLLRAIAGLEKSFDGEIELQGRPVLGPSRDIQMVFQDHRLFPWMRVAENILFASRSDDIHSSAAPIMERLRDLYLEDKAASWPRTLSAGEEARVAFARAFVDPPRVLLLDEPFQNVDTAVRYQLQQQLLRLFQSRSLTVVIVSHVVEDVVLLSDRIHLFSSRPLKEVGSFSIAIPRPRKPTAPEVLSVAASITEAMLDLKPTGGG